MWVEQARTVHEDLERLEQGIAERIGDEPKQTRDRLNRDHEISQLLDQIQSQSKHLLSLYEDHDTRSTEVLKLSAGDSFSTFYAELATIRDHYGRYSGEQAENPEQWYRQRKAGEDMPYLVDSLFSGEEAFGRYFDLHACHESFLNLPNAKRHQYLTYVEIFDNFAPGFGGIKRADKLKDQYFKYLGELSDYLETFMRMIRPLEDVDRVLTAWDGEFEKAWDADEVTGWQTENNNGRTDRRTLSTSEAVWCEACEKELKNESVYNAHLKGRKHIREAQALAKRQEGSLVAKNVSHPASAFRMKERAVAEREFRVRKLAKAMSTERDDTHTNVERKQGMTERERQQELESFLSETTGRQEADEGEDGDDEDDKISNPLKLPLDWSGKPIPYWLYRLHGLGQEFSCEICGNFVYRGRRAFEKHFTEANHIMNLRRLGITENTLMRDITSIEEAVKLWDKIQRDKQRNTVDEGSIVQMEDADGNVMPEKVYLDLQKQGLL